jgi:hypothetical protein
VLDRVATDTSTVLPPASARPAKAPAMLPAPMMLILLVKNPVCSAIVKVDHSTIRRMDDESTNRR